MLDNIRKWFMGAISDPIGFVKNWWVGMIAAMVLGSALDFNNRISEFLDRVSGGRF